MGTFLFDPFYGTIQANNLTNLHIVWANEKRPGCPTQGRIMSEKKIQFEITDGILSKYIPSENEEIVIIPENVTEIGDGAFRNCVSIKKVVLPDTLIKIGELAFEDCGSLEEIDIPEKVNYIGESAFSGCMRLQRFVFPDAIRVVNEWLFDRCFDLREVILPQEVIRIENNSFSYCFNLASVNIPEKIMRSETIDLYSDGERSSKNFGISKFKSSVITAFLNVTWGEEKIEVGKRTIVRVDSPFYCKAGHTFSAIYRKERRWGSSLPLNIKCVTARMLKYWGNTDIDNAYAYVLVEVIEIVEILSLVKGLSEVEVLNLRYSDKYELIPELDYIEYPWDRMKANDRNAENLFSIVEENQEDYGTVFIVYTDKKKVDHLVGLIMWDWWSFEISLGDHVIGLHQNCPCLPFNKEKERIIEECYYERSWKDDRRRNKKVGYTSYHRIKK